MKSGAHKVLNAPLPQRWGFWQRYKNSAIYFAIRMGYVVARLVPPGILQLWAPLLGRLAFLVARRERHRALSHLTCAFPEESAARRRKIAVGMFCHLARCGLEAPHIDRLAARLSLSRAQRDLFTELLEEGRGLVAVTGHIGNWELLAQVVAAHFPVTTYAKPIYDPRLTRFVHRLRTQGGLRVIWRGDAGATRQSLRVLRDNQILAALIDQDTGVHNVFVPFFGRLAATPSAVAALALRHDTPVIVAWTHRVGGRHELFFEPIEKPNSGDRDRDRLELTAKMTGALENAIRQAPEQWVWLHQRWRTRPIDECD